MGPLLVLAFFLAPMFGFKFDLPLLVIGPIVCFLIELAKMDEKPRVPGIGTYFQVLAFIATVVGYVQLFHMVQA